MLAGPPLPLKPDVPLHLLLTQAISLGLLGVWAQGARYAAEIQGTWGRPGHRLLASADLGFLLARCSHVALRAGSDAVVLAAELVIQWRTLQVVTAMPYLPDSEHLKQIFPGACLDSTGFQIPLQDRGPEEVLADCLMHAIPVLGSTIVYSAPSTHPQQISS